MQTLSRINSGSYIGGFCYFFYTPIQNIASVALPSPSTGFIAQEPTLKSGAIWYGPVSIHKSQIGLQETGDATPQGLLYKTKVSGLQGGTVAAQFTLHPAMLQYKYCLVGKLRSGGFWVIIGNEYIGCNYAYDFSSEEKTATKFAFAIESAVPSQVLTTFSGSNSQLPPNIGGIPEGSNISTAKPEIIPFNTGGDTVIDWTTTRKTNFGTFPTIEVWALGDDANYYLANIPIDAVGNLPTQFIIRNAGGVGYIKIS